MTMHKYFIVSLWALLVAFSHDIFSQSFRNSPPVVPVKELNEIMFGKDIILNPEPEINQREVAICQAFNGWLYAAYWFNNEDHIEVKIMKSINNGMNWERLYIDFIFSSTSSWIIFNEFSASSRCS